MPAWYSALKRIWSRPIDIIIVTYGALPSWRMKFSAPFLASLLGLWTIITVWSGYIMGKHMDYYVTKADNKVLQTKMAFVASEIEKEKQYLELTKSTEKQMRSMLGMGSKNAIIKNDAQGGADLVETMTFRNILAKKASEIKESAFRSNILHISSESRRALASFQEIAWYIANQRNVYSATPTGMPAKGVITSVFGYRPSPFTRDVKLHSGVDVSGGYGSAIHATADGVVRHVGWASGYGQAVLLDHGYGFSTLYGHCSELKVKEGQHVKRGQLVAKMGSTGNSTGVHVHYEVWQDGTPVNPAKYLPGGNKTAE